MADAYTFPEDFPEPRIPWSTNAGDSYKLSIQDSTITTTSDANYKHTRPRTTRMIHTWTFAWTRVTAADFAKLQAFWLQVGTFQQFAWKNWMDGKTYSVRFSTSPFSWQEDYPHGWQGTLAFEEV
nr:MAG TPA: minor tail protein [Caudoviricetes sp.]